MDNPNWRAVLSMHTEHDPDNHIPGSECQNIEGFCFMVILKLKKRQFVRGGNKKCRFQAALAIFEGPEGSNTTVYLV
jgi:hypothetical protein